MTSNDEWVIIQYQYDRIRKHIEKNPELYECYENGNTIKIRFVNVELLTGEIETSYAHLKESMMITNISSSKDAIIKQEIYSQMLVYNIIQSIANDLENEINQKKYKYPMKINFNMAIGFVKIFLIRILIEDNKNKRNELSNQLLIMF